jgi:peptide deformylase
VYTWTPFAVPMLTIKLINTRDNILNEDLTGIQSDPAAIRAYRPDLMRLAREKSACGIAANQVGLRENFFFLAASARVTSAGNVNSSVAHLCVNPSWRPGPKSVKVTDVEGCLSLPGRQFNVEREYVILASWTNEQGHKITDKKLTGLPARVFQHEHDHLRGITLLQSGKPV